MGRPLGLGAEVQPGGGLFAPLKAGLNNAFNMLIVSYIINKAQVFIFYFISFGFLKYYLPLGLLLRCFTPTRRIGGTIIGIALGFLFIYPVLIIMEGEIGLRQLELLSDELIPDFWSDVASINGSEMIELFKEGFSVFAIFDLIVVVFSFFLGIFAYAAIYLSASAAGYAFLTGLFFPAFNTLILVTSVRYLSKSLGEEIDVTNLTRLI
jgi:hypothetical protein